MFCTHCGAKLADNAKFCSNCGTKINADIPKATTVPQVTDGNMVPSETRKLTINRASQFICAAVSYKVIVDGKDLGKIGVGKSLTIPISSEYISVEIRCTTIMMTHIHLTQVLKVLGTNPTINFKLRYGGPINAQVSGAEILRVDG